MIAAPALQGVEVEINDGRDVEGERLGKQEASNDRDAEWAPDFPRWRRCRSAIGRAPKERP